MAKYTYLREVELKYRYKRVSNADTPTGARLTDPGTVVRLFADLQNASKEKVIAVSLDKRFKILCYEVVAIGSVDTVALRPAEVFRAAVVFNATGVIVLHNHPSGEPEPSAEDRAFTQRLRDAGQTLGIALVDHIIVGMEGYFSFANEG